MTVRTLIVDDDVRVAEIHRSYVERIEGFTVAGVANRGTEALRRVLEDQPDLVLLDIYLPDLGGLEVCRRLRAAGNLVDVIAVTAARDVDTVKGAVGLGVAQYLVKPFAFATFRDKLERYAAYKLRTDKGGEAEQEEIDAILGELRTPGALPLPKGLSKETLELVARTLKAADTPLGAVETAEIAGLSRVTARRYLEHLVSADQAELELRYGGSGRPEHRYRWSSR
ncbi:response regulator [Solirubrobacter ginsenosidimutans]|uniref:Transcriptional regulatory protein n=1 Tax=Solirubrobacter ginsenosidimutans TaxID=490573 RepID=A0A9X3N265_9ACTN|nr:response regulator [Solirubrobacter ginsenosidimutans]MDA0163493.1 response regulator [Solirubrobacter ginsenosidimutans]